MRQANETKTDKHKSLVGTLTVKITPKNKEKMQKSNSVSKHDVELHSLRAGELSVIRGQRLTKAGLM